MHPIHREPLKKDFATKNRIKTLPSVNTLRGEVRILAKQIDQLGYGNGIDVEQIDSLPPELEGVRTTKLKEDQISENGRLTLRDMIVRELLYRYSSHGKPAGKRLMSRLNRVLKERVNQSQRTR
jgi:hypothetical protein